MFEANTILGYPLLLLKSIGKRSIAALHRASGLSFRAIKSLLYPREIYVQHLWDQSKTIFGKSKKLIIQIDATLIEKMYSKCMRGSGYFYDTKLCITYKAYKVIIATISNGDLTLPLEADFLFDKNLSKEPVPSILDFVKLIIGKVQEHFSDKRLIFVLDGEFASEKYLSWCVENKIQTEVRMPKNRVVEYLGKRIAIREIGALRPKGHQSGRTKILKWRGLSLHITAHRRCDKNGQYTVVFQASTYRAKPEEHIAHYKGRWPIEKMIRTMKQETGLGDCYSTALQTQLSHVYASLVAFSLAQIEKKKRKLSTSEAGIRSIRRQSWKELMARFAPKNQLKSTAHA